MNKGIIYKVKFNENNEKEYYIKLERTVTINGTEYNIFLYYENPENKKDPKSQLVPIDTAFTFTSDLTSLIGKKLNFEIEINNDESTGGKEKTDNTKNKQSCKIISVEYEA